MNRLHKPDAPNHRRETGAQVPYLNPDLPIPERVEDLLARMDLPEKIGQMTQLDITLINTTGEQKDVVLDHAKARDLIINHHIGSFLNGEAVSAEQWYAFMLPLTRIAVEETRLGIPLIYGIDHIHGASYLKGAVIFPQNINLAATFCLEHASNAGRVTALESADLGHHWTFAPILDIAANLLWGRNYETFGEDPHLAAEMGAAYIDGYQGNTETAPYKCAATGKHFIGYSDPRSGWDRTPAHLSMQEIHEFHRPPFQRAIDAGVKTIMINSGEVNGVPVHASRQILTNLLREQMGFDGVVVTDWDDIGKLVDFHFTAENFKEATYDAVMAGIDMSMTPLHLDFNTSLLELVSEGRVPEERIDESVRRILKLKFELGLFENPYPRNDRFDRIGRPENRKIALQAARESIVLLKNKGAVLPINKPTSIAVLGPSANSKRILSGGWTIAWQGGKEERYPNEMDTVFSALRNEFPGTEVTLIDPDDIMGLGDGAGDKLEQFIKRLDGFDYLIYAGGEEPYAEFVGNIVDFRLPKSQMDDLELLSKSTSPLVLLLVQGRPLVLGDVVHFADAILFAGLPGFEGAEAIANVLGGTVNPSGKLPISYPKDPNHYLRYNHKKSELYFFDPERANHIVQGNRSSSLFPFGHGLSYTTFRYTNLKLSKTQIDTDDTVIASVKVSNTGKREGIETVLWFTSTEFGKITRPVKELRHFERVKLKPGESKTLTFEITPGMLAYPDENGRPVLERTSYKVLVGSLEKRFSIKK